MVRLLPIGRWGLLTVLGLLVPVALLWMRLTIRLLGPAMLLLVVLLLAASVVAIAWRLMSTLSRRLVRCRRSLTLVCAAAGLVVRVAIWIGTASVGWLVTAAQDSADHAA